MSTETMNISIPEALKGFIDTQLKTGGYGSTSDYVRALIRKDQVTKAEEQLREMLMEGLNSGPGIPADQFFAELKARSYPRI